jgi:sugar O-acyltransferase (sialic acid O-acetyltransferase NeuD family)
LKILGAGSGGHGIVVLNSFLLMGGFEMTGWTDPDRELAGKHVHGFPVLGDDGLLAELNRSGVTGAFVGLGSVGRNTHRVELFHRLEQQGFSLPNAIHPNSTLAESVVLGRGTVVMAGAIANPGVRVGDNSILNTGAILDHDCVVGDHAHIAPGATLSGGVTVGDRCHIGTGASVIQGVSIGEGAVVGAGAVVLADVPPNGTVVGVPARLLRDR